MLTWMTSESSPRPLGLARIIVGAAALIRSIVAWPVLTALTDPATLRVPYAGWMPDPTMPLVVTIVAVWFVSAALFTIGWRVSLTGLSSSPPSSSPFPSTSRPTATTST